MILSFTFICSFRRSNNVVQIAITKAICTLGILLPVEKLFLEYMIMLNYHYPRYLSEQKVFRSMPSLLVYVSIPRCLMAVRLT